MKRCVAGFTRWFGSGALLLAVIAGRLSAGEVDLPRHPSISPDGREVVFSWRGDLWKVAADGGEAVRLTAHPADELGSAWSPDGAWIAFESTRSGRRAVHVMRPDGTEVRQITREDASVSLSGFTADAEGVLISGFVEGDTYRSARPYRVPLRGGPMVRLHDAFGQNAAAHPDGSRFLFERGGTSLTRRHYRGADNRDLYLFDERDGSFARITRWDGHDASPRWRGVDTVVYLSDRGGGDENTVGLWALRLGADEQASVRLTANTDRDITGFDVSADGRWVVFTKWDGLYLARFRGNRLGEPERLSVTAPADAFPKRETRSLASDVDEAALSPDGKVMATVAFGQVLVRAVEEGSPTRRITQDGVRARDIAWSPDMSRLYFVSDAEGTDSIYAATVSLTRAELRERFAEATRPAEAPEEPEESMETEAAEEPAEGAAQGEDGDEPETAVEAEAASAPEAETKEDRTKQDKPKVAERWHDAMRFEIHPIVADQVDVSRPTPSPDGRTLAYRRNLGDIVLLDLITGEHRDFLGSWDFRNDFRWSPTGQHIAYSVNDTDFNSDVFVAPVDGAWEPVNVSRHPANDVSPRWSQDGKILAFLSEREGSDYDVFVVMLDRKLEAMTDQEMDAYSKARAEAVKKLSVIDPIEWDPEEGSENPSESTESKEKKKSEDPAFTEGDLEDAYRRLRRVTRYLGSESNIELLPSGERVVFRAQGGAGGTSGLYSTKLDGSDEKRLATGGSVQHVSRDGARLVLASSGRASTIAAGGGSETSVPVSYTIDIDHEALNLQRFREMARTLGRTFYHPTMKGLDWGALTEAYADLARRARTADEFSDIGMRLMGELSASHLGISAPSDYTNPDFQASGRLGIDATPLGDGGWRVDLVLPRLRTNAGNMRLVVGDVITAIELVELSPEDTLDEHLRARAGVETIVTVRRRIETDGEGPVEHSLDLLVTPVSLGEERAMRYDHWQLGNAGKVEELSGGRVGYLHIRSMGAPDLVEYERDLFAAAYGKEGLIIDVRSNGGGWTTDRVLASLMYPRHAYTVPRGADPEGGQGYPRDRLFIQRFNGPVNMLCNEKSFSNAEIISHAFKTLGRGTLVGVPTHGSVISTGAFRLIDGSTVRQPFRGWYLIDGTDMENNGAVPDLIVHQTPEDEAAGLDRQLEAAVKDLLERLD